MHSIVTYAIQFQLPGLQLCRSPLWRSGFRRSRLPQPWVLCNDLLIFDNAMPYAIPETECNKTNDEKTVKQMKPVCDCYYLFCSKKLE